MSQIRARWAAIGAAIAVAAGAGGVGVVNAVVDDGPRSVLISIVPCRIIDTRDDPQFNVGPKSTPLGAGQTIEVHAAGGVNGECDQIPADAVGLALNVTAVQPTADTHLTIWPSDEDQPNASHLNITAGASPTPNAVTTGLSADGEFSIFNFQGAVNVIADVVGYYVDHNHDDRYYPKTEADARFATGDDVAALLADYLTETEIGTLLDNYLTEAEINALLDGYVTEADLPAFLSGDGAPDPAAGSEGDMYFDETGRVLYGPKSGSGWGAGTALAGGSIGGQTRTGALPVATLLALEPLSLDTEVASFGTGITYDPVTDQFTITDSGVYRVNYTANVTAGLIGTQFQVRVDGVGQGSPVSVGTLGGTVGDTRLIQVNAGSNVDLAIGGLINVALTGNATFTIERVA